MNVLFQGVPGVQGIPGLQGEPGPQGEKVNSKMNLENIKYLFFLKTIKKLTCQRLSLP